MPPVIKYCYNCASSLTWYPLQSDPKCPYCLATMYYLLGQSDTSTKSVGAFGGFVYSSGNSFSGNSFSGNSCTGNSFTGNNSLSHSTKNKSMADDINALLLSGQFSDVTLVCSDEVEIPAHRNILSARSPVFRTLFNSNMVESTSDVVNTCFDSDTVHRLLTFFYFDDLPTPEDYNEKMLEASDYYQVDSLKIRCEHILITRITINNCLQYLLTAYQFQSDKVMQAVLDFIKKTASKHEIGSSKTFETLPPGLVKMMFLYVNCGMDLKQIKSRMDIKKSE